MYSLLYFSTSIFNSGSEIENNRYHTTEGCSNEPKSHVVNNSVIGQGDSIEYLTVDL